MLEQNKLVTRKKVSLWFYTEPEKTERKPIRQLTKDKPFNFQVPRRYILNLYYIRFKKSMFFYAGQLYLQWMKANQGTHPKLWLYKHVALRNGSLHASNCNYPNEQWFSILWYLEPKKHRLCLYIPTIWNPGLNFAFKETAAQLAAVCTLENKND